MAAVPSGADTLANNLLKNLTTGVDFTVPDVDLDDPAYQLPPATGPNYEQIKRLTDDDLTTGQVGGTGMFDQLMVSLVNHLKVEYTANRIAGAEYTKAYIGVIGAALQTAQQYLLAKDQAYWAAVTVQNQARVAEIEVVKSRVELEIAKASLVKLQFEANTASAQYGLIKMQISTADAQYAQAIAQTTGITYTNANLLPAQLAQSKEQTEQISYQTSHLLPAQKNQAVEQTAQVHYQTTNIMPAQKDQLIKQTAQVAFQTAQILPAQKTGIDRTNANLSFTGVGIDYTNKNILPAQKKMITEQSEAQRAQTYDKRSDGATVTGAIGKQKELYAQQIVAYMRDSETKLVKLYTDAFLTQKTVDEGYPLPDQFSNDQINDVLIDMRKRLGINTNYPPVPQIKV